MKDKLIIILSFLTVIYTNQSFAQYDWTRDSNNPVLTGSSTAISHICDPSVIYDYDENKFKLWAGCVESNVTYASICYSESIDGSNWTVPIIIFSPSSVAEEWDNSKTEIPTVILDTTELDTLKRYKMWYGGADSLNPDLIKIGYAYSHDGITWIRLPAAQSPHNKDGLVMIPGFTVGDAGVLSDPTAIKVNGIFHIWYNSFGTTNNILISHATSTDGINWTKDVSNPVMVPNVSWENYGPNVITEDVSHPSVIIDSSTSEFLMCYGSFDSTIFETYTGLGYARSVDGTT